jgi:hypothetical protein
MHAPTIDVHDASLRGRAAAAAAIARLVRLHEQLRNFNSQTANSLPNLISFSENSLSQS